MNLMFPITAWTWSLTSALHLYGTWIALKQFKRPTPARDVPYRLFPVSILKPLKGADPNLEENLRSYFELDYPAFELLFSVEDQNDPATAIVEKLIANYPKVASRLFVGIETVGPNPKINTLMRPYGEAKYDWVWIADSNTRVAPRDLKRLAHYIDTNVGVITSIVAGQDTKSMGGRLEALHLNTFYARGMILANHVKKPVVVGKSMLLRKTAAARFGGIKALGAFIAEDYMAGEAMQKLGLSVVVANQSIIQPVGKQSVKDFWLRHTRWGRIRKAHGGPYFWLEPFSYSFTQLALMMLALASIPSMDHVTVAACFATLHFLIFFGADYVLAKNYNPETRFTRMSKDWLMRECLLYPLWVAVAANSRVIWRGVPYEILPGGLVRKVVAATKA